MVQHVFLIGAKSLGSYGGFETFVDKLTEYHQNNTKLKYHVFCKKNGQGSMSFIDRKDAIQIDENAYLYHNAICSLIDIPEKLGSAQAIYYDIKSLKNCLEIIQKEQIEKPIIYIMACRIGPFFSYYVNKIHQLGGKVYLNPDGHEWKRSKWNKAIRSYWKLSEKLMVTKSDLVICDSINIEKYILETYGNIPTTFIAYGAESNRSIYSEKEFLEWKEKKQISKNGYYLVVGRFVPENHYETIISEFMKSETRKDLVIITNENQNLFDELNGKYHFENDKRIKFVGTVYQQELLKKIREEAFAYLHGHSVGGTNPSLLEALGSSKINLLFDVCFNREVAKDAGIYWSEEDNSLRDCISYAEKLNEKEISQLEKKAKQRIIDDYRWEDIVYKYQNVFDTLKEM